MRTNVRSNVRSTYVQVTCLRRAAPRADTEAVSLLVTAEEARERLRKAPEGPMALPLIGVGLRAPKGRGSPASERRRDGVRPTRVARLVGRSLGAPDTPCERAPIRDTTFLDALQTTARAPVATSRPALVAPRPVTQPTASGRTDMRRTTRKGGLVVPTATVIGRSARPCGRRACGRRKMAVPVTGVASGAGVEAPSRGVRTATGGVAAGAADGKA